MKAKIKSTGYKNEGWVRIIQYISELKDTKQVIVNIDETALEGYDLVLKNLKISNLNINDIDERTHLTTFTCTENAYKELLRLIRSVKVFGDCGHSFGVRINGKMFSWDGDGCDRIEEINDIDCGSGIKFDENYSKYFPKKNEEDEAQQQVNNLEETIRNIVKESIQKIIKEEQEIDLNKFIPKRVFTAINKFLLEQETIQKEFGEEDVLLDTSSGTETFYKVTDMKIENGIWTYTVKYSNYFKDEYYENMNLVNYDDYEKEYYFDEYLFKDYFNELKKDLKKGIKYLKEYSLEMDDNEELKDNFVNNL